jgi:hypothetical protein
MMIKFPMTGEALRMAYLTTAWCFLLTTPGEAGVIQSDAGPIIPHYLLLPSKETPHARY